MQPTFLTLSEVLEIHEDQIRRNPSTPGIRDIDLLESALGVPSSGMGTIYFHPTIEEMAAAYLYHIASNHPFVDGNKRTALAAAMMFLGLNGYWIEAPDDDLVDVTERVAAGTATKSDVAIFIKQHIRRY